MNIQRICLFSLSILFSSAAFGQERISVELYGGPSIGYVDGQGTGPAEELLFVQELGYHAGLRLLGRVSNSAQVVVEGEFHRRPVGTRVRFHDGNVVEHSNTGYSNNFGNYALGIRVSPKNLPAGFYIQPSVGFALSREAPGFFAGAGQPQSTLMKTSLSARIEAGVKLDVGGNYILVGVRHQHGFQELDSSVARFPQQHIDIDFRSRGSYSALFVGFGIPTRWFDR